MTSDVLLKNRKVTTVLLARNAYLRSWVSFCLYLDLLNYAFSAVAYSMVTLDSVPGVMRPEREACLSPPYIAEVKNDWNHTPPPICLMACTGGNFFLPLRLLSCVSYVVVYTCWVAATGAVGSCCSLLEYKFTYLEVFVDELRQRGHLGRPMPSHSDQTYPVYQSATANEKQLGHIG